MGKEKVIEIRNVWSWVVLSPQDDTKLNVHSMFDWKATFSSVIANIVCKQPQKYIVTFYPNELNVKKCGLASEWLWISHTPLAHTYLYQFAALKSSTEYQLYALSFCRPWEF